MPAKIAKADVALIRQETQFSCCAASIASALKAHGKDMTEAGVNKVLGASPMGGATWEAMLATVQYFGLRGTLVVPSTIAQLKAWTDAGIPVVIAWNPEGRPWSHASTVFHVDDDHTVHIMDPNIPDPSETVRVVPKAEFYKKWYEAIGDKLIVRRPAMAVEREVTVDGRQVMAGKKELRSQKDRAMSRFLQHGPVRPVDKSDTQSAMSKAQWELRKEEGRAGLPGAGMGAGYHKDKSRYDRGHGKSVEREAGSLTQPLMTRRDYGAVTARDYASILKLAVNLPADVERYVEEGTDAGMPEDKAWAVAWSRYCKYKNPESEHCQMNKSEYFPGRTAAGPYEIMYRIPGKGGFKAKAFKDNEAAVKWLEKFREKEGDDVDVRWPAKTAKFKRDVSMTLDEVADVVGPEFKEMNEDPPPEVVEVMKGMQGKTAHRSPLLAMDAFAEMLRDGMYKKDVPADPTENMSPEDAAEWERQTEEHKDEFKTADLESVLHRDDENNAIVEQFFNRTAAPKLAWKVNRVMGAQYAETPVGTYWIHPEGRHYEVKLDHSPVGYANQDQYAEDPSAEAKKMVGAHYAKALRGKTAKLMARQEKILKDYIASAGSRAAMDYDSLPQSVRSALEKVKDQETLWSDAERFLGDNRKLAAVTAGGKYGFTKGTESACGVGVNKLQKSASRIAKALYAKDESSPSFLAKHAARAGSKTASMLLKAMESIGPMAALAKNGKTAGKSGTGLYGFSEKTAKLGLDACTALHHEAGMIAGDLFARKGADPVKVSGYLAANAKKGKCAYSAMLGECSPDVAVEVTGTVKPSKKAAGGFDTNYIGGGSYSISAPKAWLEKLIAAFPKSFPRPRMMPNPNGPNDSLFTKNEKVVRAAEKWFSENGLQMTKKASDFLASDDTAEDDEVADIISKC
jgi:hypothetical protein